MRSAFQLLAGLERRRVEDLIDAGALGSLCPDRRRARWEAGLRYRPLGRQAPLRLPVKQDMAALPEAGAVEEMAREYATIAIHPSGHVMAHVRPSLGRDVLTSADVPHVPDGQEVTVVGLVIRRQQPLAKAVFITLEDEHGHTPLVVWPDTYDRLHQTLKGSFVIFTGTVSRREGTLNIVVKDARPLRVLEAAPKVRHFR